MFKKIKIVSQLILLLLLNFKNHICNLRVYFTYELLSLYFYVFTIINMIIFS
ncbi:hypothetical protein CCYN49044_200009 [Capnocytophaga cynodegmi]|uniref:Uncharacterized protein n=1 Tax=Capnocytophaga cynodegmi TaxID=28189 RepID=A0A0B7H8N8_9FLAO|nr:hypothetical protein CCYN74_100009 [Capnocytophaga cynodegmi]CEN37666.1 hypothetical protein CCYN49044_200009 [Capnocytophaga cynodegmi]